MSQSFYRLLCLLFLILANIGFVAELNGVRIGQGIPQFDKYVHFGIFLVLTALFWKSLKPAVWKLILVMAIYGALVEVVQEYFTRRTGDVWDWVADMAGVLTFFVLRGIWHLCRPASQH